MSAPASLAEPRAALAAALDDVGGVVRGHKEPLRLITAAVLARGHVLIEDVPGVGKTTLARALARVFGCTFSRIQFTADMLPSDVTGVQVLDPHAGTLAFKRGPVFSNFVLADEINRASPKTQSALLEAMSDRQVSIDDETHALDAPFCVLATQNPVEQHGAFPLPESQLDRFAACVSLGYPPAADERDLVMQRPGPNDPVQSLSPRLDPAAVLSLQSAVDEVQIRTPVADYLLALAQASRTRDDLALGVSPRGLLSFSHFCRAYAFLAGRAFVTPDDVKAVAEVALPHRLAPVDGHASRARQRALALELLADVPVPR
jgi:MoxR-like ATPase